MNQDKVIGFGLVGEDSAKMMFKSCFWGAPNTNG